MATVRKRGNRWQVQVRRSGCHALSKSFSSRTDALRWAREQELALERGRWAGGLQLSSDALASLLIRYEAEVTPRKRSRSDTFHLRQIRRHVIASCPLRDLTAEKIAKFRDDRLKAVSGSTVRKELALLGSVLNVARDEWGVTLAVNPVKRVRKARGLSGDS